MASVRRMRPSPALVISLIALFAALGGLAGALPGKNTVDSGDVKRNTLKGVDIKEAKLGQVPSAASAVTAGDANALGGQPPSAFQSKVRWVTVRANGTIFDQTGGISVAKPGIAGIYIVSFGEPVGDSAIVATPMTGAGAGGTTINAIPCGGGPQNPNCGPPYLNDPDSVLVNESNPASNNAVDISFSLALIPK